MNASRAYYDALLGAWAGRLELRVTRWAPGGAAIKLMATATRAVGGLWMATTLHADGDGYRHTTRVTKAGVLVYETAERIVLAADGRSLTMSGEQRLRFADVLRYEATGEIEAAGRGALYRIPWSGTELTQRTAIVPEGLELVQETRWSHARVLLRRSGSGN